MITLDSKICFFSSPIGLGHATRDIAVSQDILLHSKNQTGINFTSGNGASKLISEYGFNCNAAYYPPAFVVENGILKKPTRWLFQYYSYYRKCKKASEKIISDEKPEIVVSDEDFASLVCAQERGMKNVLITDILGTEFAKSGTIGSFLEKKMNHSMKNIIKKCDLVLIPQKIQQEDTDSQLSSEIKEYTNIVQLDPIVRKTKHSREQLRKKFGFEKITILVTVGGTATGKFLLRRISRSLQNLDEDMEVVLVSGPSITETLPFRNLGFVSNLHEAIYAADVVVSLAGKSTIDEARYYETPGIFIPIKGHFEQEDNAREKGYSFDDIDRLDKLVTEKIEQAKNRKNHNNLENGSDQASKMILGLLKRQ